MLRHTVKRFVAGGVPAKASPEALENLARPLMAGSPLSAFFKDPQAVPLVLNKHKFIAGQASKRRSTPSRV